MPPCPRPALEARHVPELAARKHVNVNVPRVKNTMPGTIPVQHPEYRRPKLGNLNVRGVVLVGLLLLTTGDEIAKATTVVVLRTATELVVAADSLSTMTASSHLATVSLQSWTCKIRTFGDMVLAASGRVSGSIEEQGFDLYVIADATLGQSGHPLERLDLFERRLDPAFDRIRRLLLPSRSRLDYIVGFIGSDETPNIRLGALLPSGNRPRGFCDAANDCRFGYHGVVTELQSLSASALIEIIDKMGLAGAASELIRRQATATPGTVGGPIDVVRLTTEGVEWVQSKEECQQNG